MKLLINIFKKFDTLDTSINKWLVANSITILRVCMGIVFLGFGLLKFFSGVSPIESLATRTTTVLTFGEFAGHDAMVFVAILECIIGLCFLSGMFLRIGVWLMAIQMIGAMSPLFIFSSELFPGPSHAPTLAAQYIIKDIVLVAAGMVIASTWTGAKIVAQHKSFQSMLVKKIARIDRSMQSVPQS